MTTLTVSDIPLGTESPAQRLRRTAAAVRVLLHWWGVHRALTASQKEEFGSVASADARFLTAGKKLVDVRHEAFRKLTGIKTRIGNYWRGISLPYVEPGVRLIRQSDIEIVRPHDGGLSRGADRCRVRPEHGLRRHQERCPSPARSPLQSQRLPHRNSRPVRCRMGLSLRSSHRRT